MYAVIWVDGGTRKVIGDIKSIVQLTHMLENSKCKFKVSDCTQYLKQDHFGSGGYMYWLDPNDNF